MTGDQYELSFTKDELRLLADSLRHYAQSRSDTDSKIFALYVRMCLHTRDEEEEEETL